MKILLVLMCMGVGLARYPYDFNSGYTNNNNYGNKNNNNYGNNNKNYGNDDGISYQPVVPYVLPLSFLRKASAQAVAEYKKTIQDPSRSVKEIEQQRLKWAMDFGLEKEYKEYAEAGQRGISMFFDSTRKLISKLEQFFTKSKNIGEDKRKSYESMKKAVKNLFSGLSKEQQSVATFIIDTYGINFFPFLNDIWCDLCIENGGYPGGNGGYPGNNGGYPGNNGGYPGSNGGYPGGGYPGQNGGYPGNNGGYPGGGYPGQNGGYPGNNGGYPGGGYPGNNGGYPGNNGGYPAGNGAFPGGNGGFQGGNGGFFGHNSGYPGNNGVYPGGNGWFSGSGGYPGSQGDRKPSFGNGNNYGKK